MKRIMIGFIIGAMFSGVAGVLAVQYVANPNSFPILLNGEPIEIEGYNINDYTYFKLRDISSVTGGFDVDFKNNTIQLSNNGYKYDTAEREVSEFSRDEDGNMICELTIDGHKAKVSMIEDAPPHFYGNLYFDGNYVDEKVFPKLFARGSYIYYSGNNGTYKLNINTLEKTMLLNTNYQYGVSEIYDNYLYIDGDFTPDFKIYDLEEDRLVNELPERFDHVTDNGEIIYSVFENKRILYKANLDGSDPQLLCGPNTEIIDIDNIDKGFVYYVDHLEVLGEDLYKMQVKRVNIETLEIENISDVIEAGYIVFSESNKTVDFGKYGVAEHITFSIKDKKIVK